MEFCKNLRNYYLVSCVHAILACTELYERKGTQPMFSYWVETNIQGSTSINYWLGHLDGGARVTRFNFNYYNGDLGSSYFNKTSPTSTFNATVGHLDIQLDNLESGDEGLYYFQAASSVFPEFYQIRQCSFIYLLDEPMKPTVDENTTPYIGEAVKLTCKSSSTTVPANHSLTLEYNWRVDEHFNPPDQRYSYSATRNTLTISPVKKSDALATFVCQSRENTTNGPSSDNSDAKQIIVYYGPENPRINPPLKEYEILENDNFGPVTCQADCLPNCTYEWSKNVSIVSSTAVLSMPTVLNSDAGIYVCTSTHAYGYTASIIISLNIIYGPSAISLVPAQPSFVLNKRSNLSVMCSARCWPCTYMWTGPNSFSSSEQELTFSNVLESNVGQYVCSVTNSRSNKRQTQNFILHVIYGSYSLNLTPRETILIKYEHWTINVNCTTECWPCTYIWSGPNSFRSVGGQLQLTNLARNHSGEYMCTVENTETNERTNATVTLKVNYISRFQIIEFGNTDQAKATEGETVTFICETFIESAKIKIVRESEEILTASGRSQLQYQIKRSSCNDTGKYTCVVANNDDQIQASVVLDLIVEYAPRLSPVNEMTTSLISELHGSVVFTIYTIAFPIPLPSNFTWMKCSNSQCNNVFEKENLYIYTVGLRSTLVVDHLKVGDFGTYKVHVTNGIGEVLEQSYSVSAKDVPIKSEKAALSLGGILGGTFGGIVVGVIGTLSVLFIIRN